MLDIPRKRFCYILLGIAAILGVLSYSTAAYEWALRGSNTYWAHEAATIFGVIYEGNIPSWFSAMVIFMAASLAALIASQEKRFYWGLLAFVLLYMSMDEAAELHEMFTVPLREGLQLSGYLYFGWILVGIPVAIVVGITFIPFLLKLPRFCQISFVLAALIYLTGAVGVESYSANIWAEREYATLPYHAVSIVEELMEISGMILVIHTLLWYIEKQIGEIKLRIH